MMDRMKGCEGHMAVKVDLEKLMIDWNGAIFIKFSKLSGFLITSLS